MTIGDILYDFPNLFVLVYSRGLINLRHVTEDYAPLIPWVPGVIISVFTVDVYISRTKTLYLNWGLVILVLDVCVRNPNPCEGPLQWRRVKFDGHLLTWDTRRLVLVYNPLTKTGTTSALFRLWLTGSSTRLQGDLRGPSGTSWRSCVHRLGGVKDRLR